MLHARLFREQAKFRDAHFQPTKESLVSKSRSEAEPFLDGNPSTDRPLFVQFCANKPDDLLEAAQYVAPYCDAVDLNLGCPQGIARSGHYGAFLQEDWDTIHSMIRKLRDELPVPVTAKMRILDTREKTLDYARMILDAGASILTVHGRRREQKSHNTGVADWSMIRYLRDNLPPETVLFANGNILNYTDIEPCLRATGADGVMSAEGNLSDPTIFAKPPPIDAVKAAREYWRDSQNPEIGGYRIDGVFRRYMDIIHRYVLEQEPPQRLPLYLPEDAIPQSNGTATTTPPVVASPTPISQVNTSPDHATAPEVDGDDTSRPSKKQKRSHSKKTQVAATHNPNLKAMQGHLFQLLRPMLSTHIPIRDALAKARADNIQAFETVLSMVEEAVRQGLVEEHTTTVLAQQKVKDNGEVANDVVEELGSGEVDKKSSAATREKYKRPFWVCQPHIRPLPDEAIKIGAMTLSKKEKEKLAQEEGLEKGNQKKKEEEAKSQAAVADALQGDKSRVEREEILHELPREEALACG